MPCGRRGENKAWRVNIITYVHYNLCRESEKVHWLDILDFLIKLFNEKLQLLKIIGIFLLTAKPCLEMCVHTNVGKTRKELPSNVLLYHVQCGFPCDAAR